MRMSTKFLILPLMGFAAVTAIPQTSGNAEISEPVAAVSKTGDRMLIPGGQAIGITLESDGILVLGTGGVTGKDKSIYYPAQNVLKEGDIIVEAEGERLDDKEALEEAVRKSVGDLNLKVMRKEKLLDVVIEPVQSIDDGSNKIGVWVRDSTQGIGTLTFIDPSDGSFGALGHGVYDVDTGKLMAVKSGNVVKSRITGVRKSKKGVPGEMTGVLDKSVIFGTISVNTERGVYGKINSEAIGSFGEELIPMAEAEEIVKGPAEILCTFESGMKEEYEISIEEIDLKHADADKGLVIEITDDRLKNTTGGIIQGMSGSPIIQNGKLIGAVTHVLVNDPARGYGIFIENMINE